MIGAMAASAAGVAAPTTMTTPIVVIICVPGAANVVRGLRRDLEVIPLVIEEDSNGGAELVGVDRLSLDAHLLLLANQTIARDKHILGLLGRKKYMNAQCTDYHYMYDHVRFSIILLFWY